MSYTFFFKDFIYLFLEKGREGEREGEKHQRMVASHARPYWGPGLQPRCVPRLGIEPATLCFTGMCSVHWATPTRANVIYFCFKWSYVRVQKYVLNYKNYFICSHIFILSGTLSSSLDVCFLQKARKPLWDLWSVFLYSRLRVLCCLLNAWNSKNLVFHVSLCELQYLLYIEVLCILFSLSQFCWQESKSITIALSWTEAVACDY